MSSGRVRRRSASDSAARASGQWRGATKGGTSIRRGSACIAGFKPPQKKRPLRVFKQRQRYRRLARPRNSRLVNGGRQPPVVPAFLLLPSAFCLLPSWPMLELHEQGRPTALTLRFNIDITSSKYVPLSNEREIKWAATLRPRPWGLRGAGEARWPIRPSSGPSVYFFSTVGGSVGAVTFLRRGRANERFIASTCGRTGSPTSSVT